MPKKFRGMPGQAPQFVQAADEKTLVIRFSESATYITISEEHGKPIDPIQGLSVMLQLSLQFLGSMANERSMLVGQGEDDGDTEKNDKS